MFPNRMWRDALHGTVVLFALASTTSAQTYPGGMQCQCVQQVVQPIYQTVPVTEYREVKQTVQRPIVDTEWVDREVTEYHPVTETRTAEVPSVDYQMVTEYQSFTRDYGKWFTQYHAKPVIHPWQYDPRPGFAGWLNRTGHSLRTALTPRYYTTRHYAPNVVAQMVPQTRQVAVPTTRQVAYNVTRMVPRTTTRKVAVQTVRYVNEEVTAMHPVTVMRSVPIGTRTAYAVVPFGQGASATALAPSPDPLNQPPKRTVDRRNAEPGSSSSNRLRNDADSFNNLDSSQLTPVPRPGGVPGRPVSQPATHPSRPLGPGEGRARAEQDWNVVTVPTVARVHRWTARNRDIASRQDAPSSTAPLVR